MPIHFGKENKSFYSKFHNKTNKEQKNTTIYQLLRKQESRRWEFNCPFDNIKSCIFFFIDRYVIIGNHRDAWGLGSIDPTSGTATMLEISRVFGQLRKEGKKKRMLSQNITIPKGNSLES